MSDISEKPKPNTLQSADVLFMQCPLTLLSGLKPVNPVTGYLVIKTGVIWITLPLTLTHCKRPLDITPKAILTTTRYETSLSGFPEF